MTTRTPPREQKLPPGPWQCDHVAMKKTAKIAVKSRICRTFFILSGAFAECSKSGHYWHGEKRGGFLQYGCASG